MAEHSGVAVDLGLLRASQWVVDIIYFPIETELLRHARRIGCRAINGGGMVVFQAVEAFRLISDREAAASRMQAHFEELSGTEPNAKIFGRQQDRKNRDEKSCE